MDKIESQLVRSALGRVGFIGELYDSRSERFSSTSLFEQDRLPSLIKKVDANRIDMDYRFTDNLSDRFNLLNIEGELQVCFLSGLINVEGSGKFLKEEKKTHKSVSCSLICKLETVSEKIFGSFKEYLKDMDLSVLKNDQYTHVVTEIVWGANCILKLEASFESDANKVEVEGNLQGELKKIASLLQVQNKCGLNYANNSNQFLNNTKISISADIIPEKELPISIESFCNLVSSLPNLIKKSNDGKGKPLKYVMIPLSTLREMAQVKERVDIVVQKIDEAFLISTICFFEEIVILKLKLSDFIDVLKKNKKYISDQDISRARQHYINLKQRETSFKNILAQNWVDVRSGFKTLNNLVREVEKFKNHKLQLLHYEEYLDSCAEILEIIDEIKVYTSKGVEYLGRCESLSQEFMKNISTLFIVLVKSKKFEKENPDLHQATCTYFMSLVEKEAKNIKYIVVDLDYQEDKHSTLLANIMMTTCMSIKEGKIIEPNLYKDYLCQLQSNFVKVKNREEIENKRYKPGNRTFLEIVCPGQKSNMCSPKKRVWICFFCKENVEYDFAGYFYCGCGKGKTTSYEYRCNDDKHGYSFISASTDFINNELSALKPFPEINILILGQTGVGKSTWINSIVNYLKYKSLNIGRQNGVICTIPIRFTYFNVEGKKYDIKLGDFDDGEDLAIGQSATQYCRTYCFHWKGNYFRLIDTPGIGDVRGIDKDKENMRHIIDYIGHLQELHGVCILLRANESKIGAVFSYCLKELLIHLHKDIAKNIVFCFTNARNSFYSPGQTSVLVKKLLYDLKISTQLFIGQKNSFCLDNEAFLFLCMLQYPDIQFSEDFIKNFEQSWNISLKETCRLFETILQFEPHLLSQTVSLCTARNRILLLSKPLVEISKTIQMNVRVIQQHKNEVEMFQKTLEELHEKLYFEEIQLKTINLSQPRTVCTNSKCVEYLQIKSLGLTEIEYKTHCHENCLLKNVVPKTTNNYLLKKCKAMKNGICINCGCSWETHMHLFTAQTRIIKKVKSRIIENDINKNLSSKETKQKIVEELENKIKEYENEQETIMKISVKMGIFLKNNAISVYNDAISSYLKYIIEEAESNPYKTLNDEKVLKQLKETLKKYEKEIEILQNVIETNKTSTDIPIIEDIYEMEKELYSLKLTGKVIQTYVETQKLAISNKIKYLEVPLGISNNISEKIWNNEITKNESYLESMKNYVSKKTKDLSKVLLGENK